MQNIYKTQDSILLILFQSYMHLGQMQKFFWDRGCKYYLNFECKLSVEIVNKNYVLVRRKLHMKCYAVECLRARRSSFEAFISYYNYTFCTNTMRVVVSSSRVFISLQSWQLLALQFVHSLH